MKKWMKLISLSTLVCMIISLNLFVVQAEEGAPEGAGVTAEEIVNQDKLSNPVIVPSIKEGPMAEIRHKIDISAGGPGKRMWLGDLDGDGRLDFVTAQPTQIKEAGGDAYWPYYVNCMTAFDLTGKVLWQIGKSDPDKKGSGADIPIQIYDIDNDGFNEVLACMEDEKGNGQLRIFNGKTGELKKTMDLPYLKSVNSKTKEETNKQRAHDCIIICNLEGSKYAQDIVLKDRYGNLWGFDKDLNMRFHTGANTGHYPWPIDLNGDGRDEIVTTNAAYDYKGEVVYKWDEKGHTDSVWAADLDQNPDNGMEVLVAADYTKAYGQGGKLIWAWKGAVEPQNICVGKLDPSAPGLQTGGLDRIDRSKNGIDGMFLMGSDGKTTYKEKRPVLGWSTAVTLVHNWDGTGNDHMLAFHRGGDLPDALYNGKMELIVQFPKEGGGQFVWGDLLGDGTTQLIGYQDNGNTAYIYSNSEFDINKPVLGYSRPQPKRLRNWTRYWGSETAMSNYAVNYVTKNFSNNNIAEWSTKYNGSNEPEDAKDLMTRADFVVLLMKTLKLNAFSVNKFDDIKDWEYWVEAVNGAEKLGIVKGDGTGNFNPKAPITRQDMAVIALRALQAAKKVNELGGSEDNAKFADNAKISDYAIEAVGTFAKEGIYKGDGINVNPLANITRSEMAKVIARIAVK